MNLPQFACVLFITLTISAKLAAGATYKQGDFSIEYNNNVPLSVVKAFANDVNTGREIVLNYLKSSPLYKGTPFKEPLVVHITKKVYSPFQDLNQIYIPENRVLKTYSKKIRDQDDPGMAIIHELTHVYAVSFYRKKLQNGYENRFYDDGLAVFLEHRFRPSPGFPEFGRDLDAAVAQASVEHGGLIPLKDCEDVRHTVKGPARRRPYLQEGSFTQYLIERYGLSRYLEIYQGKDIKQVTGKSFESLEAAWKSQIAAMSRHIKKD